MDVHVTIKVDKDAVSAIVDAISELAGRANQATSEPVAQAIQQAVPQQAVPVVPTVPQTTPAGLTQPSVTSAQTPTVVSQPANQQITAVPSTTHSYTLEELAGAAMTLMDKGMQTQLQSLLAGYGVEALPMLPPEQYGNFATALRGMGAQI